MKSRFLIALPLAAALMAPAYAQQDNSSQQNAPAATQSTNQSSQDTAQNASSSGTEARQPLKAERHEGFWGKINPMARKKYVQRQMEPIRGRVNELDELTAANAKALKDFDARAQEGIRLASAKASEADQHAVDAGNRAQTANQTAEQANSKLQTVQTAVTNIDQYQPTTQTEIRLRPGQTTLSKNAKDALDQLADSVKGQNAYLIEVQGFSNGRGTAAIENSQKMAQSVVRYLVINHDIPVYKIYLLGMGNAPKTTAAAEGEKPRRAPGSRVEISLLKNPHLDQLAGSGSSATPETQGGASGTATQPSQQPSSDQGSSTQSPSSNMQSQPGQTPQPPRQ